MTMRTLGGPGSPTPDDAGDPDVAVPKHAPPHEPPIPVLDPVEPDKTEG